MTASSTSSSEPRTGPRARSRTRRALLACAVAAALCLGATRPLNDRLVEEEFATSAFGRAANAAAGVAGDRPLVAILGTSQTQSAVDAMRIETQLGGGLAVADVVNPGLHASVYPYLLRRLAERARLRLVVLELGHIAHDQYGGAWIVRNFLEDEPVRAAFDDCPRGRELLALWRDEHRFPWLATPRLLRVVYDGSRRAADAAVERAMRERRGFVPFREPKDFDAVVRAIAADPAYTTPDLLDASPQQVFVAAARACAETCRARGIAMAVYVHPVNRPVAARIKVIRHFEETVRSETIPTLRAEGIDVIVPPDRFFEPGLYYDHAHLRDAGAEQFTEWLGGELGARVAPR